ncbi:MAG: serine hydrolase [Gemmatimonadales bacterium]|nr:serine hydrolase [Gemmatimonadales bacterium]NIO31564.1 serine hydrolase [Gemmatimonadota bacterium]
MLSMLKYRSTHGLPNTVFGATNRLVASVIIVVLVAGLSGCGDDGVGPVDTTDIGSLTELYGVPGVSVAVIRDFQIDCVEVHGVASRSTQEPVTASTLFQAASISKPVSAVAALRFVQEGKLALDTDINDYLTSWQVPENEFTASEKVTLRRLLSHTAGTTVHGFRGYRYTESVPTLIQVLNGAPPANSAPIVVDYTPGSDSRYSGGGYIVMQQALIDIEATTFPEIMSGTVLQPIGMTNSTFEQPLPELQLESASAGHYSNGQVVPGDHHVYPEMAAAGLWTTPRDLARFLIELQLSLQGQSNQVLDQELVELMLTEVSGGFGLGFAVWSNRGEPYFGHGGANEGYRCFMLAHRSLGFGVVVMTNSDNGSDLADAVIELIGEREGWPGY